MHEFMLSCDNILVFVHQIHVDISFEQLTINWFSSCAGFPLVQVFLVLSCKSFRLSSMVPRSFTYSGLFRGAKYIFISGS